jgi:catechol 2,3-dioxygenase-like lactoylglutathione lyase family enzyme
MSRFFGKAVHAAFVVPDIDQAIGRMLASGIGPFYVMRRIRVAARYRGQRHDVLITAAFVYSGNMQYEFVQQHDAAPSAYRDFIVLHPPGGLHHVAYFSDDFGATVKHAKAQGSDYEIVQEFITADGFAYEIYLEPKNSSDPLQIQLMMHGPMDSFFAQMEQAAATWDGKDPIRNALDLLPAEMRPPVE